MTAAARTECSRELRRLRLGRIARDTAPKIDFETRTLFISSYPGSKTPTWPYWWRFATSLVFLRHGIHLVRKWDRIRPQRVPRAGPLIGDMNPRERAECFEELDHLCLNGLNKDISVVMDCTQRTLFVSAYPESKVPFDEYERLFAASEVLRRLRIRLVCKRDRLRVRLDFFAYEK